MKPSKSFFWLLPALTLAPALSRAQQTEKTTSLPLKNVVLFSSGVGYFGRSGKVSGDAAVDLPVRNTQISDILKSLVLFDPKGKVMPVTYSIQDYLATRSRETDLAIDPSASPGTLLKALQGAVVRLEKGTTTIEGRVVSVNTTQVKSDDVWRSVEAVTLLTPTGLKTVRLDDVTGFAPVDPALNAKFLQSLEKRAATLTQSLDDGVRDVTLHFAGRGERDVRAGYLLETPAWKTSYRLVLAPNAKPYLQGWAVVENTTDADWSNVQLSLVSGRPISFIQNLATPVYITRPVEDSMIPNASPRPQTFAGGDGPPVAEPEAPQETQINAPASSAFRKRAGGIFSNSGSYDAKDLDEARDDLAQSINESKVAAQANGSEKGDLFVYAIDSAVTLPRGEAAMVPIVSQDVNGEAVSIVESNNTVMPLTPMNGFCLRNGSDLHLQGGSIAVYNDGVYGGDALITNVSPGESRLISYALDLDLTARLDREENDSSITALSTTEGSLIVKRQAFKTQFYALRNKSKTAKTVYIQQPALSGWELIDPKQLYEKSNDGWRFKVELKAGESKEYAIRWQQPTQETYGLRALTVPQIGFYVSQDKISPELKKALLDIIAQKKQANALANQIAAQQATLKSITDDQDRIRENMRTLARDSKLYKTYEAKLALQESQIEKIMTEIERLRTAQAAANSMVEASIAAL